VTGTFALRDHTADVGVEASGETLGDAFAACADGMAAAMCDRIPDAGEQFDLAVRAEGREALLFDYLDRLIYERDVRNVLPVDSEATVHEDAGEWAVRASARGVPLDRVHAREVKAVTYSEMSIEETDGGWHVYVVLDV
jgi:SHS2 domain-containing protein